MSSEIFVQKNLVVDEYFVYELPKQTGYKLTY